MNFPPMPHAIGNLPLDERGFPVPFFVEWIDGKPDFRVTSDEKRLVCYRRDLCWICGAALFGRKAFTIGPMCAVNRTASEPAAHPDCCHWSAKVCPFLSQPKMRRNDKDIPADTHSDGIAIMRNPGVALIWVTRSYELFPDGMGGFLFEIGNPVETHWYAEGRPATYEEVRLSFDSGLPLLLDSAKKEGPAAVAALHAMVARAKTLLPAA